MKILNRLICLSLLTMFADLTYAEDAKFGVGAEVDSQVRLYFPIDMGNMIIEPGLVYFDQDRESGSGMFGSNSDSNSTEISVGIFKKNQLTEKTLIYYGARVGLIKQESASGFSSLDGTSYGTTVTKSDGYSLAPTIGAQYLIGSDFHIGLDLSLRYSDTDGDVKSYSNIIGTSKNSTDSKSTSTNAKVILRYYF